MDSLIDSYPNVLVHLKLGSGNTEKHYEGKVNDGKFLVYLKLGFGTQKNIMKENESLFELMSKKYL